MESTTASKDRVGPLGRPHQPHRSRRKHPSARQPVSAESVAKAFVLQLPKAPLILSPPDGPPRQSPAPLPSSHLVNRHLRATALRHHPIGTRSQIAPFPRSRAPSYPFVVKLPARFTQNRDSPTGCVPPFIPSRDRYTRTYFLPSCSWRPLPLRQRPSIFLML